MPPLAASLEVEPQVATYLHELVSKVIDDNTGDYTGVRVRKRQRGDARVFDDDVVECMNAELSAEQAKSAALETKVAALEERLRKLEKVSRDCQGRIVAEMACIDLKTVRGPGNPSTRDWAPHRVISPILLWILVTRTDCWPPSNGTMRTLRGGSMLQTIAARPGGSSAEA